MNAFVAIILEQVEICTYTNYFVCIQLWFCYLIMHETLREKHRDYGFVFSVLFFYIFFLGMV